MNSLRYLCIPYPWNHASESALLGLRPHTPSLFQHRAHSRKNKKLTYERAPYSKLCARVFPAC